MVACVTKCNAVCPIHPDRRHFLDQVGDHVLKVHSTVTSHSSGLFVTVDETICDLQACSP